MRKLNLNLNQKMIDVFGENRVKWIKGIIAGFLIITIVNFGSPFTFWLNGTGIHEIWITYILLVYNAGIVVMVSLVIFILGKPIYVANPDDLEETITEGDVE